MMFDKLSYVQGINPEIQALCNEANELLTA